MKPYQSYIDVGEVWILKIPSHWKVSKLKFLSSENVTYGINISSNNYQENGIRFIRTTDIDDFGRLIEKGVYLKKEDVEDVYLLIDGDFLISRSGTVGRAYVHKECFGKACYAGYLVRFRFLDSQVAKYIFWFTKTKQFQLWLDFQRIESTISNVNGQKYANLSIGMPISKNEIYQITNFLDRKTAQIDILIAKKQRLIELLQEYRTALINQAVTKGLDPNVPMKESGVECLGEIPAHWEIIKTKYLFSLSTEKAPADNEMELISLYTDIGVRPRKELIARGNKASTTDGYWIVKQGDIIVNKLLAWMGAIGYSAYNGVTSPAYDILRKISPLNSKLYHYLFRCGVYLPEFKRRSRGIMEMRLRLYFDEFGQIPLVYPPLEEQNDIVYYLDSMEKNIDIYSNNISRQIDLLNEYRTSLVSDAVTGKIDVQNQG